MRILSAAEDLSSERVMLENATCQHRNYFTQTQQKGVMHLLWNYPLKNKRVATKVRLIYKFVIGWSNPKDLHDYHYFWTWVTNSTILNHRIQPMKLKILDKQWNLWSSALRSTMITMQVFLLENAVDIFRILKSNTRMWLNNHAVLGNYYFSFVSNSSFFSIERN